MHIHILGICGTFMGGLAVLATELNHQVTGSDLNVYPPMSTQLNNLGVKIFQGYDDINQLNPIPDCVVVGNVMTRGKPVIEALLNQNLPLISGPEWLSRYVLRHRHVIAISGTHGKTTTSSMVAWILEYAGLNPGFLIGGVPNNFGISARLGTGAHFVVEADEYDCAFFDKRSKFVHYWPQTLIINNIEFDHADIFPNLAAIQLQFHHLIRTVPENGLIVYPGQDQNVLEVIKKGCWSKQETFGSNEQSSNIKAAWSINNQTSSFNEFDISYEGKFLGRMKWDLLGRHNAENALAAMAAALHAGVEPILALQALEKFKSVKRRLEIKGIKNNVTVYDDFAHHPTAIQTTLKGLRAKIGKARIIAVLDLRSNTMKAGHHKDLLSDSVSSADTIYIYRSPDILWNVEKVWQDTCKPGGVYSEPESLLAQLLKDSRANDHIIFMSNGGFHGMPDNFLDRLMD